MVVQEAVKIDSKLLTFNYRLPSARRSLLLSTICWQDKKDTLCWCMWLLARSKRLDSTHKDKVKPDISFDSFLFHIHDPDSQTSLTKAQETHTCAAPSASHLFSSNQVEIKSSDEKWQNIVFTWNWGRSHPREGFLAPSPCPCGWGTPLPSLVRQS